MMCGCMSSLLRLCTPAGCPHCLSFRPAVAHDSSQHIEVDVEGMPLPIIMLPFNNDLCASLSTSGQLVVVTTDETFGSW